MALTKYLLVTVLALTALISCDNPSLQKYLVDKQDDDKFLKIDVAASLLQTNSSNFSPEEKEILNTIKKVNVVAYPIKDGDSLDYQVEKEKLAGILSDEKYKTLIKMGSPTKGATLKYTGEEDAINELIIFASDNERGFAVLRVLGDKMRPDQMVKLMKSVERGDMDVSQLNGLGEIFKD